MDNTTFVVIVTVAALALLGVVAISIVTNPQQLLQQEAYATAAQTSTTVEKIPVDEIDFVPCAADGEGEEVHLAGKIRVVEHTTLDGDGGFHLKLHANDQGISGTGLTTGDKYHRTGATNIELNGKVGAEETAGATFNFIGQGGNENNFLVHVLFHITVNPNGSVTAFVDILNVECR
jgi:hypothetical protein